MTSKTSDEHALAPVDEGVPPWTEDQDPSDSDDNKDLFTNLRVLAADCGPNKNDAAIVLIIACIERGINTRGQIRAVISAVGLNPDHVSTVLRRETGTNPYLHRWRCDDGVYHVLTTPSPNAPFTPQAPPVAPALPASSLDPSKLRIGPAEQPKAPRDDVSE